MTMGPSEGEKDNSTSTRPSIQSVELRVSPTASPRPQWAFREMREPLLASFVFVPVYLAR